MYNITNYDLKLLTCQHYLHYPIKIEILENNKIIDVLHGVIHGGSSSINADSDIRRTFNATVIPTWKHEIKVNEDGIIWLNKDVHLYIGLKDIRTDKHKWYSQGYYVFANSSGTYDIQTNQLSITCNDWMAKLDGTKNGQIGALTTLIPAYEENPETGEPVKYTIIREAMITILTQLGRIKNYLIDDIGEYKAMPDYNPNWQEYRKQNELWNTVPYDIELPCGCSVFSILQKLRDLYPNYEMFFDENGVFKCQMIPSCYHDDIVFRDEFLQKILISESTSVDLLTVRNITEVWGSIIEVDYYTESCSYFSGIYTFNLEGYEDEYKNGDKIGVKVPMENPSNAKININSFGNIDIYDENTESPLEAGIMEAGKIYAFKIKKQRIDKVTYTRAYYLGQWQPHAISVLTDGTTGEDYTTNGITVARYSKEYFQTIYNCNTVEMNIIPNSPFVVQKIGEILDVKTGGEYENIDSDLLAASRAHYENWKSSRLTDSITITTHLIPFADVNIKASYRCQNQDKAHQYIIKSVEHNFDAGQTTLTMMRFYPLYEELLKSAGSHNALSYYSHKELQKYTHEELNKIISGEEF